MDIRQRAIKSVGWYAATRVWGQVVSWAVTIVLARLLVPADYGIFAMALAVIGAVEIFQELGLGVALVQRRQLRPQQINAVFWINLGASTVVALLAVAAAPLAANFYREPRLVGLVQVLAVIVVLNAVGMVPYNLLTREIEFRRRSLAEALGTIASAGFSVWLAHLGYGFWALAVGHLIRAAVRNGALLAVGGWRPGLHVSLRGMPEILRFGLFFAGSNAIGEVAGVVNRAVIGRFLGSNDLGLYSMAASLGRNPLRKLSTSLINQLSLPIFSRLQAEDERLRGYFLKITKYVAVIAFPMQLGLFLVADDLVTVLLSDQWRGVVGLFQAFSLAGIFQLLPLPATPVLTARGKTNVVMRFSTVSSVVMLAAYIVGAQYGLVGVAAAYLATFPLLRVYLLSLSLRELDMGVGRYLGTIVSPLVASLVMAGAIVALRTAVHLELGALERLVLDITVGALLYGGALLLIDKALGAELRGIVSELFAVSRA